MATIGYNGMQEISRFDPNRYGGLKDLNLYIDYHTNNSNSNYKNNGIFQVGNTYYFVTTGSNASLTKSKALDIIKNYGIHDSRHQTGAKVYKITDPTIIQTIQTNASESRGSRMKMGTVDQGAKNIDLIEVPKFTYSINDTYESPNNTKPTSSGGGYATYSAPPDYSYYKDRIKDLEAELAEVKRPKSGPELAEHYGIQDTLANQGYWAGIYANDFNQYYDDLTNKQNEYRSRYARNNGTYDDYLEKEYINSYNNASNARTTRGAVAANALSTGNVNDYNSSKNDNAMMQNVNALNAQRIADLAGVDYKAEQTYADVMAKLMELGANHDASVVQDIVNGLGAASKVNAEQKNYAANRAAAANTAYNGLVNAKATANASTDELNSLYNYYLGQTGGNKTQASNMMTNYWGRIGAGY